METGDLFFIKDLLLLLLLLEKARFPRGYKEERKEGRRGRHEASSPAEGWIFVTIDEPRDNKRGVWINGEDSLRRRDGPIEEKPSGIFRETLIVPRFGG